MNNLILQNEKTVFSTERVETRTLVTSREFESYTRPGGKPVVIRGWMDNWRALSIWNFQFFKTRYGDDQLKIEYGVKKHKSVLATNMTDYLDYITSFEKNSTLHRLQQQLGTTAPFYCTSYKPFADHPELWSDFHIPPFVADWWPLLDDSFTKNHFPFNQGWVLISGEGAVSSIHVDSHHTITWLAQIQGKKACYLFAPEDSEAVYDGDVDPIHPDIEKHPRILEAKCHFCILHPGDMLFLPPDWWHHVVSLVNSITISCNFVNHTNFGLYIRAAYGSQLPDYLAMLPSKPLAKPEITASGEVEPLSTPMRPIQDHT